MNDEEIKKIIDSPQEYEDSREESYISYARDFFKNSIASCLSISHSPLL